jgi:uncharacterized SAM-dependent methyltransferase
VIISKANISLKLKQGELIHTEHSHKYKISQIEKLMDETGFVIKQNWLDVNKQYAITLVSKK